jgi:predicted transcriptional regulator of viral defense system
MRSEYTKESGLGKRSRERLADLLRQSKGTISAREAAETLKFPAPKTAQVLARLAKHGWLSRVRRGLYIPVPIESRTADVMPEDPCVIAERIYAPCYIGGWSAAENWHLTEQIFRTVVVMTTRRPRNRNVSMKGISFLLRTVQPEALFGTKPVWRGQVKIQVADPTRTIVDLLNEPRLGGGLRSTVDIFKAYMVSQDKNTDLMIDYAKRLGNKTVFKRLGLLAEQYSPSEKELIKACRSRLSQGNSKLDPDLPSKQLVTRWKLWVPAGWMKRREGD